MTLLVDMGNSRIKWCPYDDRLATLGPVQSAGTDHLEAVLATHWALLPRPERVWISNVGGPLLQFHAQGKIRILAVAANKRLAAAPDIPTAIEAGLPGMVAANFNGLFAPAGVPKHIIKALADETRAAVADPQVQDLMIKSGFEPVLDSGPEAGQQEVESEYARWTPIIKKLGFKVQ